MTRVRLPSQDIAALGSRRAPTRKASLRLPREEDAASGIDRPFTSLGLQRLVARLPPRLRTAIQGLRRPRVRWLRLPAGILLLIGGTILAPLPLFGLWMLPVGLVLLGRDVPLVRNWMVRILDKVEEHRRHWFRRR